MLTDGAVSQPERCTQLIEENCKEDNVKVFTFGVGDGCSAQLVKESAEKGKGQYFFVGDDETHLLK